MWTWRVIRSPGCRRAARPAGSGPITAAVPGREARMKTLNRLVDCLALLLGMHAMWALSVCDCSFWVRSWVQFLAILAYIAVSVLPSWRWRATFRLTMLADGTELLIQFLITLCINIAGMAVSAVVCWRGSLSGWTLLWQVLGVLIGETVLFWNGMLRVYLTSVQLGIRWRVIGLLLGWVPVANLWALVRIIRIGRAEVAVESDKIEQNIRRAPDGICATRYPVLLVHGVFFRDLRHLSYWGRIPRALAQNGATLYYGQQQSAASVADCGQELAVRIRDIVETSGCEKVNIVAHSKGGLDARWAISCLGMDRYVASLTTINTPHRGCLFAEYLLNKAPGWLVRRVAGTYNRAFRRLGDAHPDFTAAVTDLTNRRCAQLNLQMPDREGVYYQSVGSRMARARSGKFPLNVAYPMVRHFDGDNDGLVSVESSRWGERFMLLSPPGRRGISHGDVIDLNRENIGGFDVREFYVGLLADLKQRGF